MITNKIKKEIINHSKSVFPEECCGFIIKKKDDIFSIPCENIAKDKINSFLISTKEFLSIKSKADKLLFLYHNHIDEKEFSLLDKKTAFGLAIDLLLYINSEDLFKVYYHNDFNNLNYLFNEYNDRTNNCFHLIQNYFKNELNININLNENLICGKKIEDLDVLHIALNNYKKNNLNYIQDNLIPKKNDILLLKNRIHTHLAVYLGNDKILHQPINKISMIEDYSNKYKKETICIFRSNNII